MTPRGMTAWTLLVLGLALSPTMAAASDEFDRVLTEALTSHPSIEGRRAEAEATQADREGAEWQRFPTPAFDIYERNRTVYGSSSRVLSLEQPIWTGGRISAAIASAGYREAAARAAVVEARETIALRLVSAYVEVLRQQQRRDFTRESVREHENLVGLIGRRVEQEVSPPADRDFALSRLAQARIELSVAEQGIEVASSALAQLVGRPVSGALSVSLDGRVLPPNAREAIRQAIERSPVLARLDQSAQSSLEEINARRAALLPQFAIRAERQYGFDSEDRLLFVMRMQPGAGLSAASAISAAQKRAEEARLAGDEARRALTDQVQSAFVQWQAARNRLDSARESMTLNQSLFESYTRQYVAGRKTWIDVLNAVREVSQTQYAWADARSQVLAAGLNLWILSGDLPLLQTARSALP